MKTKSNKQMMIVLGASRFGATIASLACEEGTYTAIVDKDENAFKKLDSSYSGFIILGDATDQNVLEKANIHQAKEVVIATSNDNTNIYLALMIESYYHPDSIIVRLRDEKKSELLNKDSIHIISTSSLSIQAYKSINQAKED